MAATNCIGLAYNINEMTPAIKLWRWEHTFVLHLNSIYVIHEVFRILSCVELRSSLKSFVLNIEFEHIKVSVKIRSPFKYFVFIVLTL